MPEAAARRRLAAILAADVVGYSRLMETAEAATLARLKAHRAELIDPLLADHGGRLIKLMGDGALVEFPSVVEAVECAVDIQRGMAEREAGRAEGERIRFRIGINLGDVLIDGDDLYGDGVNIAARLEGLAEPGGIVLSAAAFDQVRRQAAGGVLATSASAPSRTSRDRCVRTRIGEVASVPVATRRRRRWRWCARRRASRSWRLRSLGCIWTWQGVRPAVTSASPSPWASGRPIAVLPFTNLADPADAYFSDGLTEDVAGALARFGELAVIDPAASLAVRDRNADIAAIGRELGARYLVRGTVRRDEQRVRVDGAARRGAHRRLALVAALRRGAGRHLQRPGRHHAAARRCHGGAARPARAGADRRRSRRAASRSTISCCAADGW